jgi:putative ABC transport system ATP-binding protein
MVDLNHRPPACKAGALTPELIAHRTRHPYGAGWEPDYTGRREREPAGNREYRGQSPQPRRRRPAEHAGRLRAAARRGRSRRPVYFATASRDATGVVSYPSSERAAPGSAAASAKVSVEDLTYVVHRRGETARAILSQVTFTAPEARVFTILGPSGAGKSTLLRCINRLVEPTSGRVLLDGQPVGGLPVQELRRRVGMVFQTAALFDGSVLDNVLYGPRLRREEGTADDRSAHELGCGLLRRVGLPEDFCDKPAAELSGGEAQRVSLARALANRPEVLLLDEPTASLDPSASLRIERLLGQLADETDLTFIFVTHNLEQARRIGDEALLLIDGRVVEQGPLRELMRDPEKETTKLFMEGRL